MAEEHVFLHVDGVYVSNTRVVIRGTTYATANITSVRKNRIAPNRGCALLLAIVSGLATLGAIPALFIKSDVPAGGIAFMFVALCAVGVFWFRSLKPTFHVMLASAGGERQGFSSFDETLVDEVTGAVAAAITHRG